MNPYQGIIDTLGQISTGLGTLKGEEKTKFEASKTSEILKSTLQAGSGIVSSIDARGAVDNTQSKTSGDVLLELQRSLADERMKTAAEAQKRKSAEANASLLEQQKGTAGSAAATAALLTKDTNATASSPTPDASKVAAVGENVPVAPLINAEDAIMFGVPADKTNDTFTSMAIEKAKAAQAQLINGSQFLHDMALQESEDAQLSVRNIDSITKIQREQIMAEYKKRQAGAQLAGILGGRAQYSPEEHEGILQEIMQEGISAATKIELAAEKEKLQIKKDLREFNHKSYLEGEERVEKLNNLKLELYTTIHDQLSKVETEQRTKIKFDQEQGDRMAGILGEELAGASEAEIKAAATANGVDYGALLKATRTAQYTKQTRAAALEKTSNKKTDTKPLTSADIKSFSEQYGFSSLGGDKTSLPPHWTRTDLNDFVEANPSFGDLSPEEKAHSIKLFNAEISGGELPTMTDDEVDTTTTKIIDDTISSISDMSEEDFNAAGGTSEIFRAQATDVLGRSSEARVALDRQDVREAISKLLKSNLYTSKDIQEYLVRKDGISNVKELANNI